MSFQPSTGSWPNLWLLSDARNDPVLEQALEQLPEGSGFVFRHYHLGDAERRNRFEMLRSICRSKHHALVLSDTCERAAQWQADGVYGPTERLGEPSGLLRIATAHNRAEIDSAIATRADAVMISPVFATRSHANSQPLGSAGFKTLAERASQGGVVPIALGGMNAARAEEIGVTRWAAIDGLSAPFDPKDS